MKRILCFLLLFFFCFAFYSCDWIRNDASVENFIGEPVKGELPTDGDPVRAACAIITLLCGEGTELPEFSDPRTVASLYRDRILSHMVNTGYSKYSGNTEAVLEAEKKYPKLRIPLLIPAQDFEYTVYTNFGGGRSVKHGSGTVFTYLSRVKGYAAMGQVKVPDCAIDIDAVFETENTYLIQFYLSSGGEYSPLYRGVFVKRTDGSLYLGKLTRIGDPKIVVPRGEVKTAETEGDI